MLSRIVCFLSVSFLICGCNRTVSVQDGIYRINLVESLGKSTGSVTWNDMASKVSIVPLQTDTSCLLGEKIKVKYIGDTIVLEDTKTRIFYAFDSKGRFLSKVDRRGKGPGEYSDVWGACVAAGDPLSLYVNAQGTGELLRYDLNGRCLSTVRFERNPLNSEAFIIDSTYVTVCWDFGMNPSLVERFDLQGKHLDWALPRINKNPNFTSIPFNCYTPYPDRLIVDIISLDTVYTVTADSVYPFAYVELGDYRLPKEWINFSDKMKAAGSTHVVYMYVRDLPNYLMLDYIYRDKHHYDLWEKKTEKLRARRNDGEGFDLRFDNGETLAVVPDYIGNGKAVAMLDAYKVNEMIPGVREDDNPVLVVMDL